MLTPPNTPPVNGKAAAATSSSQITETLERLRQHPHDDALLFAQFATLAHALGRTDLEAEFQTRAERVRTGHSPEPFRVMAAGANVPRLDGPAQRANAGAADAYLQRGLDLFKEGKLAEAEQEYHWAIRLKPDLAEAHGNLGVLLGRQKRLPEAEAAFRLALQFNPTNVAAYTNLGSACLEQGRPAEAETWFRQAILIRPDLADSHRLLGTALETIPANGPYLKANPQRILHWQQDLAHEANFRVGIVWQGSKQHKGDRVRSVRLERFASLAAVSGVRLLSLQKGAGTEQLPEAAAAGWEVVDYGSRTGDSFADTAALMMNLDLLVTIDTAVCHVAGALGLPVWVATPFAADWRWLREREDSPWYPTLRLFRQTVAGVWDDVFARITAALTDPTRQQLQRTRQTRLSTLSVSSSP